MMLPSRDFESRASAIPPLRRTAIIHNFASLSFTSCYTIRYESGREFSKQRNILD